MATLATLTVSILGNTKELVGALSEGEKRIAKFGDRSESVLSTFAKSAGVAMAAAGVAVAGGLGAAVTAATGFEKSLSAIKAVSGATADEMQQLSALALQLGKDTSFSASEAAAGIEELVKGGLSVADIMGGAAQASLNLAAAGGVSLADAAEIASNAMAMFNLTGADMHMVADQIAGAANASSLSVSDFKFSLGAVGAVASLAGQSFQDTATAIALMGASGIKGSDAGTSLKTMLMNLIPTTDRAAGAMSDLGLITADGANKFLDAEGNFRSLRDISGELSKALDGLSESQKTTALEAIFGSDAIRAASVMAKAGAENFDAMAASMSKVTAESVAQERLNNFAGSLEQLKGALETAAITLGMAFMPALKQGADALIGVVNAATPMLEVIGQRMVEGLDGAKGALDRLWTAAQPARDLLNSLGNVVQAYVLPAMNDLKAFNFEEAFSGLQSGAAVALVLLEDAFKGLSGKITTWLQAQVEAVNWQEVWNTATGIATGLAEKLDSIDWGAAGTAIGTSLSTVLPQAVEQAFSNAEGLASTLTNGLKSVMESIDFKAVADAVVPKALGFTIEIVRALMDVSTWLTVITEHWDSLLLLILGVMFAPAKLIRPLAGLLSKIPLAGEFLAWMVKALNEVGGKILGAVGGMLKDMGMTLLEGILKGLGANGPKLFTGLRGVIDDAIKGIASFGETMYIKGLELMSFLGNAIATHGPKQVLGAIRTLFGLVDGFLAATVGGMLRVGASIITALWNGISSLSSMLFKGVQQLIDSTLSGPFKVAATEMLNVGKSIVQGIASGIRNSYNLAMDAAKALANMLPQWVKDVLGIKSPSKVFAEIGENIGAGLSLGIISKQAEVQDALSKLVGTEQLETTVAGLVQGGSLAEAVEHLMAAGATAEEALNKVAQLAQSFEQETAAALEKANGRFASAFLNGLGKGAGDAVAQARASLDSLAKGEWIASLETNIKAVAAEVNKALAAGLDPTPILEQARPVFEAYQQAVTTTAEKTAEAVSKAGFAMESAMEAANNAVATSRAVLERENDAIIASWNARAAAAKRAADIEVSLARAQMDAGAQKLESKRRSRLIQIVETFAADRYAEGMEAYRGIPDAQFRAALAVAQELSPALQIGGLSLGALLEHFGVLKLPEFASGVRGFGGGLAWVGERGKELVRLPRGSDVIPHDASMRMAGGSAPNVTVNVYNPQSDIDFKRRVEEAVRDAFRGGGLDFLGERP